MTEMTEEKKNVDGDRLPPGKVFYLQVEVWNADGSMSTQAEGMFAHNSLQAVIDNAVEETKENGTESYVYECRAVRRVYQPDVKVITLKVKG